MASEGKLVRPRSCRLCARTSFGVVIYCTRTGAAPQLQPPYALRRPPGRFHERWTTSRPLPGATYLISEERCLSYSRLRKRTQTAVKFVRKKQKRGHVFYIVRAVPNIPRYHLGSQGLASLIWPMYTKRHLVNNGFTLLDYLCVLSFHHSRKWHDM